MELEQLSPALKRSSRALELAKKSNDLEGSESAYVPYPYIGYHPYVPIYKHHVPFVYYVG